MTSAGERIEIWIKRDPDGDIELAPLAGLGGNTSPHFEPVRKFQKHRGFHRGRQNFHPVHSLGRSVFCESRQEAIRLLELDFFGVLRNLAAQPMRVVLRGPGGTRRFVPDFWYERKDGSRVLENVRLPDRRDAGFWESSTALSEVAELLGWTYIVSGESIVEYGHMLELLSAYATMSPRPDVVRAVVTAFAGAEVLTFGELTGRTAAGDLVALASLYALMWRRFLVFDLSGGLHSETPLQLGGGS